MADLSAQSERVLSRLESRDRGQGVVGIGKGVMAKKQKI
jgi:hypothetical protein